MPRFIMLYRGPAMPPGAMEGDAAKAINEKWGAWFGRVGPALTDGGAPLVPTASVVDDGSAGVAADVTGYSIVEAPDAAAARAFTRNHPHLDQRNGQFSIDVFELLPIPGM
ncbi:MAG: hypothetical protein KIT76_08075 [Pseudolabrys sp.]|nr:hypothetical protein [Pseudolabrys sp.]MCW5697658.1 hypothetical protein [Bauldia sp.]